MKMEKLIEAKNKYVRDSEFSFDNDSLDKILKLLHERELAIKNVEKMTRNLVGYGMNQKNIYPLIGKLIDDNSNQIIEVAGILERTNG